MLVEVGDGVGLSSPARAGVGLAPDVSTYDDDDIEFDFFDEPETVEATRAGRAGGSGPAVAATVRGGPLRRLPEPSPSRGSSA